MTTPLGLPALYAPPRTAPTRTTTGRVIWQEDFTGGIPGTFNDGIGSASIDYDVMFNGMPTMRLDAQGVNGSGTLTGGNVQLTLGGSNQTITSISNSTLVCTSSAGGSPAGSLLPFGYIVFVSTSATATTWPAQDGNSYVLSYTGVVVSGVTTAWVITFSGVNIMPLPQTYGLPSPTLVTNTTGTATCNVGNPNPNPTGSPQPSAMVVHKRRMNDQFSGTFGTELWMRPTSLIAGTTGSTVFVHRFYNRNGYNFYGASVFPEFAIGMNRAAWSNDYVLLWAATGTGTSGLSCVWTPIAFSVGAFGQHQWDPVGSGAGASGLWDRAGCWNFSKIVANFAPGSGYGTYVSYQWNDLVYPLNGLPVYQSTGDQGAKIMHFSAETGGQSTTRRFLNIAHMIATNE